MNTSEKYLIDALWSRAQLFFAGAFLSRLFLELLVEPFVNICFLVELIIISYFGSLMLVIFWNDV